MKKIIKHLSFTIVYEPEYLATQWTISNAHLSLEGSILLEGIRLVERWATHRQLL